MKILLVAAQSPDTVLGRIGIYCKKALGSLGHDFEVFDFRKTRLLRDDVSRLIRKPLKSILRFSHISVPGLRGMDIKIMNRSLLGKIADYKPDILLILMGDTISALTLKEAKKHGAIIVNWFHDPILAPTRKNFIVENSPYYDYFFMVESQDVLDRVRVGSSFVNTLPLACDPDMHKSMNLSYSEKELYGSDVCFVGSVDLERVDMLLALSDLDLKIWGNWTEKIPALKRCYRKKHVYGEEAAKIYNASKIVIDMPLSYSEDGGIFYVTPRLFEVPACGAFLLTKDCKAASGLYETGKELICYRDLSELKELVRYYLEHDDERRLIAGRAQARARRDYTYENRIRQMFEHIGAVKK